MKPEFYRKVLKNGMTIIFEKRDIPIVSVAFAVRNGGVNEKISEKGISHFIEHMLYKGTKKRNAKKIAEEIEKRGGELNGFTDENITAYWCKMPSEYLNVALDVLGDMIKNPLFKQKELVKERKVIFEEIKKRKDNPQIYVLDGIQSGLYSGTLGRNLIGTCETMNAIGRKKLVEKFKQVYCPNNLILGIVGNADFGNIVKYVEKNFGMKKGKVLSFKIGLKNETKIVKRKGIEQVSLVLGYHVPLSGDKKSYAAEVLNILMAGGMSSRLFHEIREKRNLAYAILGDANINSNFAYNLIYAGTTKENYLKVKDLILKEFKRVSEKLSLRELNQVKEQIIGNYHLAMEDSQTQLVNLILHEIDGDASKFYEFEKNIRAVKLAEVKNLAKLKKYSFFALIPEEKSL